jgi:hypothetical protein
MENQKTFHIGIAMAGAVSAGAYTAGVMDYLLETLENWQKAKDLGLPGVPRHEVVIDVLSGSSAGGMTAILTAASVQKEFPHINQHNYFTFSAFENPLFNSWVNLTEEPNSDIMSQMLGCGDIDTSRDSNPGKEVRSVFNSLFIEKIVRRVLDSSLKDLGTGRPYFAPDLELLTTLTNLRGFNHELEFLTSAGKRFDRMTSHRDLMHFQLNPEGTYRQDGKIPFHFNTPGGLNKDLLIDGAIATGAFPAGLAPRLVVRDPRYINDSILLNKFHKSRILVNPDLDYRAVCVDGGVINNEPYDLTELILIDRRKEELKRTSNSNSIESEDPLQLGAATFDTSVIMIDPFPCQDIPADIYPGLQALKDTSVRLWDAIHHQLMVKTELLEKAYDDNNFTRFMIAPVRSRDGVAQENSLACGSLGGFGGFFSKELRIHDFMLGRRNCQKFIRKYFCVPESAENPVISYGYANLKKDHLSLIRHANTHHLPIIPDIRVADNNVTLLRPRTEEEFPYPSVGLKSLLDLEKKVQKRFYFIANILDDSKKKEKNRTETSPPAGNYRKTSWWSRNILDPVSGYAMGRMVSIGKSAGSRIASRKFIDVVIADFEKRGLLGKDSAPPAGKH